MAGLRLWGLVVSQIFVWVLSFNMQYVFLLFGIDRGIINYTFLLFLFISFCIFFSLFLYQRTFLHHKQCASETKSGCLFLLFFLYFNITYAPFFWFFLLLKTIEAFCTLSLWECYQPYHLIWIFSILFMTSVIFLILKTMLLMHHTS